MIGPAHQMASSTGSFAYDGRSSGLAPSAKSIATLTAIWMPGPAKEMPICSARVSGRMGTYEA